MTQYDCQKQVNPDKLFIEIKNASLPTPFAINANAVSSSVLYENGPLDAAQEQTLTSVVTAHVPVTTEEGLTKYLDDEVAPFRKKLVNSFAAQNITLGITQAGKADDVLAIFTRKYDLNGNGRAVALKDALDTGSLYVAIAIIEYVRNNPTEYDGLSPYITDARLLQMKNDIEAFLGIPLTP